MEPTAIEIGTWAELTEDSALALLQRGDLDAEVFERIATNGSLIKNHRVKLAVAAHPRAPRHVALPLLRHLFTFDLMQVVLTPATPADIKKAAEDSLLNRLETISSGEKLALARRASAGVAGG